MKNESNNKSLLFFVILIILFFIIMAVIMISNNTAYGDTKATKKEIDDFRLLYKAEDPPRDSIDESLVCLHVLDKVLKEGHESIDCDKCPVCGMAIQIVVIKNKYGLKPNQIKVIDALLDAGHIPKSWDIKSDTELEIRFKYYKVDEKFVFRQDDTWQASVDKFKLDKVQNEIR